MEIASQVVDSQLPTRSPSAITVRSDSVMPDAWEGGEEALPQIVRQVQEGSRTLLSVAAFSFSGCASTFSNTRQMKRRACWICASRSPCH